MGCFFWRLICSSLDDRIADQGGGERRSRDPSASRFRLALSTTAILVAMQSRIATLNASIGRGSGSLFHNGRVFAEEMPSARDEV